MIWYCRILRFDGDYAIMVKDGESESDSYMVARALIPDDAVEGDHLKCENFMYSIV